MSHGRLLGSSKVGLWPVFEQVSPLSLWTRRRESAILHKRVTAVESEYDIVSTVRMEKGEVKASQAHSVVGSSAGCLCRTPTIDVSFALAIRAAQATVIGWVS